MATFFITIDNLVGVEPIVSIGAQDKRQNYGFNNTETIRK